MSRRPDPKPITYEMMTRPLIAGEGRGRPQVVADIQAAIATAARPAPRPSLSADELAAEADKNMAVEAYATMTKAAGVVLRTGAPGDVIAIGGRGCGPRRSPRGDLGGQRRTSGLSLRRG